MYGLNFKDRLCSTVVSAVMKNAEHVGENPLPCNAAARLQARDPTKSMSPLAQLDRLLEDVLRDLTLRFVVPRLERVRLHLGRREPDLRSLPDQEHLQFAIDPSVASQTESYEITVWNAPAPSDKRGRQKTGWRRLQPQRGRTKCGCVSSSGSRSDKQPPSQREFQCHRSPPGSVKRMGHRCRKRVYSSSGRSIPHWQYLRRTSHR